MLTTLGPFDEGTEVPVAAVNGWRCWCQGSLDHGRSQCWANRSGRIEMTVEVGIVTLRGEVPRRLLIDPLIETVRRTAGVISVHDHLRYAVDDSVLPPCQPVP